MQGAITTRQFAQFHVRTARPQPPHSPHISRIFAVRRGAMSRKQKLVPARGACDNPMCGERAEEQEFFACLDYRDDSR
jgi:hypothetical protein